jgi:hypothetical protein
MIYCPFHASSLLPLFLSFMIFFINCVSLKCHHTSYVYVCVSRGAQLEATTNYEERRKIRERIRQVMADKEGSV